MSSGSESDEDYVPEEPEQLSEEESADEETEQQYEIEVVHKTNKRKTTQEKNKTKKIKTKNGIKEVHVVENTEEKLEETANPEEDKKREEDLWAKFLEGTDIKRKSITDETNNTKNDISIIVKEDTKTEKQNDDIKSRETRIFEFAGEKLIVEDDVIKEKIKTDAPAAVVKTEATSSRKGGLSNILGQIGKKGKLSTLEKSKLDWTTYKKQEGIEEEIQSHNKGKQGYLDRRDFLERADLRQYELERDLRLNRRSNR